MVSKQKAAATAAAAAKEKNIKWLKYHNTIYTICMCLRALFFLLFLLSIEMWPNASARAQVKEKLQNG